MTAQIISLADRRPKKGAQDATPDVASVDKRAEINRLLNKIARNLGIDVEAPFRAATATPPPAETPPSKPRRPTRRKQS